MFLTDVNSLRKGHFLMNRYHFHQRNTGRKFCMIFYITLDNIRLMENKMFNFYMGIFYLFVFLFNSKNFGGPKCWLIKDLKENIHIKMKNHIF